MFFNHPIRHLMAIVLLATIGTSGNLTPANANPLIGKSAPNFNAIDSNGKKHQLSDYRGRTVVLEWTNHECPYVQKHYGSGNMQTLQKNAAAKGIVWLTVISSAPGKQGHITPAFANKLTKDRGAEPTAILYDETGKIGKSYGATATPNMYVIDPKGTLVYRGAIDNISTANVRDIPKAKNYVAMALAALENKKAIDPNVTPPYGCSIKYQ